MIRSIDFNRQNTQGLLSQINPLIKAFSAIAYSLTLILIENIEALIALNLLTLILLVISSIKLKQLFYLLAFAALSLYSIVLSQGLFYSVEPLTTYFSFGEFSFLGIDIHLKLSYEGMEHGLLMSLRVIAPLILTFLIYMSTATEAFLNAFKTMRIPKTINLMLITALRFIPLIIEDYQVIRKNQKLKNYSPSIFSPIKSLKFEMKMLKPLFFNALRQSNEIAYAVLGRGFLLKQNKKQKLIQLNKVEFIYVCSISLFLLGLIFLKCIYFLYLHQIYYHSSFRSLYDLCRHYL